MKSLLFCLFLTPLFALSQTKQAPVDPNKTYTVTMHKTVAEWQAIISALANSEFISSASSTRTQNEILLQVNQQLTQDQEQQRKQDSLQGPNKAQQGTNQPIKPNTKDKAK